MSSESVLVQKMRKVSRGGGGNVIRIPSEIKEYVKEGDSIDLTVKIEGKELIIIAVKSLFSFDVEDIRNVAKGYKLTEKENKIIGDVQIFQAEKNSISLSFTKNLLEKLSPAYVTVSFKKSDVDYDGYSNVLDRAKKLKKEFDVITLPEGDLNTINLLKDPKRYKLTEKKAIESLRKSGRKVGVSVTIRFNSMKNTLDQITSTLNKLS